uniref:Uncharacterized protein n=1 Tax=Cannabis sativa TaxID=3483 RepID=A0A803PNP6_CANSA
MDFGPLEVISVVGMGGLGKTTLAQLAFNNETVKNHFPKKIWVSVSEPFDLLKIASAIIENLLKDYQTQIQGEDAGEGECRTQYKKPPTFQTLEAAFNWISIRLGKGRFLLVLDDVWNEEYKGYLNSEEEGASVFQNLTMRSFFQDFQEVEEDVFDDDDHQKRRLRRFELGDQRIRHLTIAMESKAEFPNLELTDENKKFLHTFLILRQGKSSAVCVDSSVFMSLKHLRTLNLSKCGLKSLPENIGSLIHLRYLEVTNNPLVKLPDTICDLCNLQTFRLEHGCPSLLELPEGIGKLVNLRFLYLGGCSRYDFKGLPKETLTPAIGKLPSLETLHFWGLHIKNMGPEILGIAEEQVTPLYPRLKVLKFTSAENWLEWKTDAPCCDVTIMPCLQSLHFSYCKRLQVLPGFLHNVPLQFIYITEAEILEKHCRVRDKNEWPKISHTKNILLNDIHVQKDGCYFGD